MLRYFGSIIFLIILNLPFVFIFSHKTEFPSLKKCLCIKYYKNLELN